MIVHPTKTKPRISRAVIIGVIAGLVVVYVEDKRRCEAHHQRMQEVVRIVEAQRAGDAARANGAK